MATYCLNMLYNVKHLKDRKKLWSYKAHVQQLNWGLILTHTISPGSQEQRVT